MTTGDTQAAERARLTFDFEEDVSPAPSEKEIIDRKVAEISEQAGFTATVRQPGARSAPVRRAPPAATAVAPSVDFKPRRSRARTGRTYPFNTKLRQETYDKICAQADAASTREGRPVSLAEIIERAVAALEGAE